MLYDIDEGAKFGTQFFIQFCDLLGQCLGRLAVFRLNSTVEIEVFFIR